MLRKARVPSFGIAALVGLSLLLAACGQAAAPTAAPSKPAATEPAKAAATEPAKAAATAAPAASPAAQAKPAGPADKVTFMAGYKAQANVSFVAVYVAQEKGYYKEQNLDVEIKHVVQTGDHYKLLAAKQIDVTTALGEDVIKAVRNDGVPMISIGLTTQEGDRGLVALADSGIKQPKDFEGKTIGYKGFQTPDYLALLAKTGVDRGKLKEVSVGYDPRILTEKKVDVLPVFLSNEPDIIKKMGFDVNVIDPATYGVEMLGQTWVVNPEALKARQAVYARWLKATVKGLAYAFEDANQKEVVDIVMKYAPQEDRDHQAFMLGVERGRSVTDLTKKNGLGWMTAEQWARVQDILAQNDLIKQKGNVTDYFDDSLLKQAYKDGKLVWP